MSGGARLFVGVRISSASTEEITELVESMQPVSRSQEMDVRWLPPANYHVTLKFLGWTDREVINALKDALAPVAAESRPFSLSLKGVGAFPSEEKARVLWIGASDGSSELMTLAESVEAATVGIGFPRESRDFHPHLTIGRLKKPGNVQGLVLPFAEERIRKCTIDRLILFESVEQRGGVTYEAAAQWPLS